MAQHRPSQSVATLRIITYRISSTPTKQLPHITSQLAGSLWTCRDILSSPSQATKSTSEVSTLVHRFKTTLSSLLQDRTIEGRWAAVVLVKVAIEAGGVETLSQSGPWVRSLLAILKKPDPPTTHIFAVSILTRIFILTWDYSNLIREITTPNLPAFVSTCLNNIESRQRGSPGEIQTILEAFATLIPRHPTIFRSQESQIRAVLLKVLSGTSTHSETELHYSKEHKLIAQRVFALLHYCAPKQGGAAKWNETVTSTVSAAHITCDQLFRSIKEDWSSTSGVQRHSNVSAGEMELNEQDGLGLSNWKGVFGAEQRLITLLGLLQCHTEIDTAGSVTVPIGLILDLLTRLFTLSVPKSGNVEPSKINPQIPKDERESMFSVLPSIHVSSLQLVHTMVSRFGAFITPVAEELLNNLIDVFRAEKTYVDIRTVTYQVLQTILELTGPSMSKDTAGELAPIIRACCDDLLPADTKDSTVTTRQSNNTTTKQYPSGIDLSLAQSNIPSSHPTLSRDLSEAAKSLLATLFTKIIPTHLSRKVRVQMERTAVLTKHRAALIACVMNPSKKDNGKTDQASLLPLLARLYPDAVEVEALLRPRMPVVRSKGGNEVEDLDDVIDDDELVDEISLNGEAMEVEEVKNAGTLLGHGDPSKTTQTTDGETNGAEDEGLRAASPRPTSTRDTRPSEEAFGQQKLATDDDLAKRPAAEPLDQVASAKRLRPSSVAQSLEPELTSAISAPAPVTVVGQQDVSASPAFGESLHTATLRPEPRDEIASSSLANAYTQEKDIDRDEDDLSESEIPALDAGLDTDPEDEDDDGDDEEVSE